MKKLAPLFSIFLIGLMLILATISQKEESAIMDEVAHIPAGYSYLTQKDMRLNPEHPPLLKDLAAIPLLFIKGINFPDTLKSWTSEINSQWDFGFKFLYESGNDADKIIFWSRIPMLLLLILLGFFIYRWTKELYGKLPALLAIFLFSFSPTFLAHARYVTTDVGAAFAFFFASYFFIKYLKNPCGKNLIWAGISFGIAQLIKFSLVLLIPYFGILLLIWIYVGGRTSSGRFDLKKSLGFIFKFILILVIGCLLIYPVYLFHVANYPAEKQISDINFIASQFPFKPAGNLVIWMSKQPILKPYAQYLFGLFMVFQRATGGNTTFFLGEVTNKGWLSYFPIVYAIKEPLVLHILTIIVLLFLAWPARHRKPLAQALRAGRLFIAKYFVEISMLIFLAIYWIVSIKSNLNIGVRHILPTFPFVYILISGQIKRIFEYIKNKKFFGPCIAVFAFLMAWYTCSSISIFPNYLTYFNELVGKAKNGYVYVTDSNLDWGQDLKRLAKWVDENNIQKIKIDYFGGATAKYYLGDKVEEWHADYDPKNAKGSWLAISATFLQQNRAIPTKGFEKRTDYYLWLNQYQPKAVIGNSIFVYFIP